MSNVKEINEKNLIQLKSDEKFISQSRMLILQKITSENNTLLMQSWEKTKEHFNEVIESYNYFKSDGYKEITKLFNVTMTCELYANEVAKMSKSNFLECVQCAKLSGDIITQYENKEQKNGLSRKGLLKFNANLNKPSTQVDTTTATAENETAENETATAENESKIEVKKLSIKIDKNNKIVVDGKATLEQLTLIQAEIKRQITALKKATKKK